MKQTQPSEELFGIVDEVGALARRRGWSRVATASRELLAGTGSARTFVGREEPLRDPLLARLRDSLSRDGVEQLLLSEVVKNPLRLLAAQRVVVALDCRDFLDAEEIEALSSTVLSRPSGSYALVYVGLEAVQDDQDLVALERSIRSWALDDGGPTDLTAHGVYLAGGEGGRGEAGRRIEHDTRALEAWIEGPQGSPLELQQWRALRLLDHAEEAAAREPTEPSAAPRMTEQEESRAADELGRCRNRLARRLRSDLDALERALVQDLDALEVGTRAEVRRLVDREGERVWPLLDSEEVSDLVVESLRGAEARWRTRVADRVGDAVEQMDRDLRSLFGVVDWHVVNRRSRGEAGEYPEAFFGDLEALLTPELPDTLARETSGRNLVPGSDPETRRAVWLYSLGAAVLSAGLAAVLKLPNLWLPMVAGSAAAGTGWLGQSGRCRRRAREIERRVSEVLHRDIARARKEIERALGEVRKEALDVLPGRVRRLEQGLRGALGEWADQERETSGEPSADAAVLRELRRKTATLTAA